MRHLCISACCILLLCLGACTSVKEIQCTGISGFSVEKISAEGIDGDILLKLKNPNSFGFSILRSSFDVYYSGVKLGQASLVKRVKIKRHAEETYSFRLNSDFRNTNLADVMKLMSGATRKNLMEIKGNLRVRRFPLYKAFPVNVSESLRLK